MYQVMFSRLFWSGSAVLWCVCISLYAQTESTLRNGQTRLHNDGFIVWDTQADSWVKPEQFWANYASRKGSRNWGTATTYPPRAKTQPHDVVTIVTPEGVCLMEFYHSRWRRANDVWRWSQRFSNYAGCANVHNYRSTLFND